MKKITLPFAALVLIIGGWLAGNMEQSKADPAAALHSDVPQAVVDVKKEGMAPNSYIEVYVTKVVDGDTLEVTYKGEKQKVRMLYVDTPESVKSGVGVQEYALEAKEFISSILLDKSVKLVFEKGIRDRYGRLLAHVLLEDGRYINGMLVKNGFARVEVVSPNSVQKEFFYKLEDEAVISKVGLWGLPRDKVPFVKDSKGRYIPRYEDKQNAA